MAASHQGSPPPMASMMPRDDNEGFLEDVPRYGGRSASRRNRVEISVQSGLDLERLRTVEVDCLAAQSRFASDKQLVDDYIASLAEHGSWLGPAPKQKHPGSSIL